MGLFSLFHTKNPASQDQFNSYLHWMRDSNAGHAPLAEKYRHLSQNHLRQFSPDVKRILNDLLSVIAEIYDQNVFGDKASHWTTGTTSMPGQKMVALYADIRNLLRIDIEKDAHGNVIPTRRGKIAEFAAMLQEKAKLETLEKLKPELDAGEQLLRSAVARSELIHNFFATDLLRASNIQWPTMPTRKEEEKQYCEKVIAIGTEFSKILKENEGVSYQYNKMLESLEEPVISFFDDIIKFANIIAHIDSVLEQLELDPYRIEDHITWELAIRVHLAQEFHKNPFAIYENGGFTTIIFPVSAAENILHTLGDDVAAKLRPIMTLDETDPKNELLRGSKTFTGRIEALKEFFTTGFFDRIAKSKEGKEQIKLLSPEVLALQDKSPAERAAAFDQLVFIARGDYCVLTEDIWTKHQATAQYQWVNDTRYFNWTIMQTIIFQHTKHLSFDKLLGSIVEPFFLSPRDLELFNDYKTGREKSCEMAEKFLRAQLLQEDITDHNFKEISDFMTAGYAALERAQTSIAKAQQENPGRLMQFHGLVDKPYEVHEVMMNVQRMAIFSAACAIHNTHNQLVYLGRESGFEGGNTVAVHGYNNYGKYMRMLEVVAPVVNSQYGELFDDCEGFLSWIFLGTHDAATYDRQNTIPFSEQQKFGNGNKDGHRIIGASLLREDALIQELFSTSVEGLQKEHDAALDLIATIVKNHDHDSVYLDLNALDRMNGAGRPPNPRFIKELVCISLCGLADNSAGIGFLDKDEKVHVDPWVEKGMSVFDIPRNRPILFEILGNLAKDPTYYNSSNNSSKETTNDKWSEVVERVRKNVEDPEHQLHHFVRDKLLRGLQENEFSPGAVIKVTGILNSGLLKFLSYDGQTLRVNLLYDTELQELLYKIYGSGHYQTTAQDAKGNVIEYAESHSAMKFTFARLKNFVGEYKSSIYKYAGKDADPDMSALFSQGELFILNKGFVEDEKKNENTTNQERKDDNEIQHKIVLLDTIGVELRLHDIRGLYNTYPPGEQSQALIDAIKDGNKLYKITPEEFFPKRKAA